MKEGAATAVVAEDADVFIAATNRLRQFLVVENGEVFLHAHEILPPADVVLHASGRISKRSVNWLALQDNLAVIHAGDYDAVGLDC